MNIEDLEGFDDETRKEIEELLKVTRENDGGEAFSEAKWNLSKIYYSYNLLEKSIETNRMIAYTDSKEYYSKAQYNIGIALNGLRKLDEAKKAWLKVIQKDSPIAYARAQYNIAVAFNTVNNTYDATKAWNNVMREGDKHAYAKAQTGIANILFKSSNYDQAIQVLKNISRNDDSEIYSRAQINIGIYFERTGDHQQAIQTWKAIQNEDSILLYEKAQFIIGMKLIEQSEYRDVTTAKQAFENITNHYHFEKYCLINICDLLLSSYTESIGESYLLVFIATSEINKLLRIDFEKKVTDNSPVERKLAHYTSTIVTNELLKKDIEKSIYPSLFRLNTINNVNDPSEGKVLFNFLNDIKQISFDTSEFEKDFQAFIGCFSLNHDSLNQFRLYGKKDRQEASGISLVFDKDFYDQSYEFDSISNISFTNDLNKIEESGSKLSTNYLSEVAKVNNSIKMSNKLGIQRIMRCVYVDPTNGYFQLAQRSKLTFYREFEDEKIAKLEWEKYERYLNEKNKNFNHLFKSLKSQYLKLIEALNLPDNKLKFGTDPFKFLNSLLLPLKYLIKHSAFQEEQECRMIYTTGLDDKKVQMNYGEALYVEYEVDVKSNLDKIYIAPAATQYQPYLAKLLCDTNVKIELSNNPYRQT